MIEALVNPDRSTVILGLPSFFAVMTNFVHQVVGTPGPIFFSTPLFTSASIIAFTWSLASKEGAASIILLYPFLQLFPILLCGRIWQLIRWINQLPPRASAWQLAVRVTLPLFLID